MNEPRSLSIGSESGFKVLFEYATVGIVVIDSNGNIEIANPCIQKMFGYENGELIGKPVEILVPLNIRERHEQHREKYFNKPKARPMGFGFELNGRKKDGQEFPVEISLGHYMLDDQRLAVAFVTDISDRTKEHDAQVQSEERFRKVFNSSPVAKSISRLDDGIIVDVNDSFLSLFEYKREEIIGKTTVEVRMFKNEEERNLLIEDLRKKGIVRNREMIVYSSKSKPVVILASSVLINLDGKEHLLTTRVDITDKKRAEEELKIVNEDLEKKIVERTLELTQSLERERALSEMKSRFVSMASHEFRTPLTAILSSVALVNRYGNEEEEKRRKHMERIRYSVQNLNDILNDFLSLDKLEQGIIEIEKSSFDLRALLDDVAEEVQSMLKEGQKITFIHEGELTIFQDKKILRNVLLNLISNAIKYSEKEKEIVVKTTCGSGEVSIAVHDEGIGIAMEEQQFLFTKFYRAQNAMSIHGTGLGLNIVKRYMELMGGSLSFVSRLNEGSVFTIRFPQ